MKTFLAKKSETEKKWWLVDAKGQTLGRLASQVASLLRGKTKPEFTPHIDTGDFVIVVNAEKVLLTGKKEIQKVYRRHSGIPGGFKTQTVKEVREKRPVKLIETAVKGMLPHTTLRQEQFTKLKVYQGGEHPHKSQKPMGWKIKGLASN